MSVSELLNPRGEREGKYWRSRSGSASGRGGMGVKRGRESGSDGAEVEIEYEKLRNARLAENQKRMEELGLVGLSKSLSEGVRTPGRSSGRTPSSIPRVIVPAGPARRSSRLSGSPIVSYAENMKKSEGKEKSAGRRASQAGTGGFQPEIYTEEDEKLLGDAKAEWQLFVDGYDANGTRIYDPVRGKTCHQCRQKTMGRRTSCSRCQSLHGQFCGDCLYMRYGENVVEANGNEKWECPVCRLICNCSFCRLKRGWTPTGSLYRKIKSLGYKSVAHYLVLTRRGDGDEKVGDAVPHKSDDNKAKASTAADEAKDLKGEHAGEDPLPHIDIENPIVAENHTRDEKPTVDIVDKATPLKLIEGDTEVATIEQKVEINMESCPMASKPAIENPKKVQEVIKATSLSSVWRSRRALSTIPKEGTKDTKSKEANVVEDRTELVGNEASFVGIPNSTNLDAEKPQDEPKKRGRGRPRNSSPATGKGSFYASAPKTRRAVAKPEPVLNPTLVQGEQPVLMLDSDSEDSCDHKISNTRTIAQRLQRRVRAY